MSGDGQGEPAAKWNLRMVAAQRDLWRPTEALAAFRQVGFNPSLSKVAALWGGAPITVRLDDLDKICTALNCTVADLPQASRSQTHRRRRSLANRPLGAGSQRPDGALRPVPRTRRGSGPRCLATGAHER